MTDKEIVMFARKWITSAPMYFEDEEDAAEYSFIEGAKWAREEAAQTVECERTRQAQQHCMDTSIVLRNVAKEIRGDKND